MGSLFSALTTAVAGLNAQSSAIGNISDNLANAQTTGYKSVGTDFEELVNSSSATVNNPGGVSATPAYQNDVQGSIVSSNTATSLAISGAGYFAVETATADSSGNTVFTGNTAYTREGDFTLDKNGFMVNGSGFYLTGYSVNSTTGAVNTSSTQPIQVSALLDDPVPTGTITYNANLPSNQTAGYTSSPSSVLVFDSLGNEHDVNYTWTKSQATTNVNYGANLPGSDASVGTVTSPATVEVVDASGNTHALDYTWTKTGVNSYSLGVNSPDASYTATVPFTFDSTTGALDAITAGTGYTVGTSATAASVDVSLSYSGEAAQSINLNFGNYGQTTGSTALTISSSGSTLTTNTFTQTPAANTWDLQVTAPDATYTTTIPFTFNDGASGAAGTIESIGAYASSSAAPSAYAVTTGTNADVTIDTAFSTNGGTPLPAQTLTLNFGTYGSANGVTQFSDTNSTVAVTNFSQDGLPSGSFNNLSISSNGFVSINYSNGTNRNIAQIPIVQFYAQDQLQRITGGAYEATLASGNARYSTPGSTGAGTITSSSLEQSNVDIATQFTQLIQAQQVYSANAKIVTTTDNLLQVTLNMVQ